MDEIIIKENINMIFNVLNQYKKGEISLEEFIELNNSICFINYHEFLNIAKKDKTNNKLNLLSFDPNEKLKELEESYLQLSKNNNNPKIENIELYIKSKEEMLYSLFESKLFCLGWIRDVCFDKERLIFKISPQIHIPYELKNSMTKEECSKYFKKCKMNLELLGYKFHTGNSFKNNLSKDSVNMELFENFIKKELSKIYSLSYEIIFNDVLDTINIYCPLDTYLTSQIKEKDIFNINDKYNITGKITNLEKEKILKILNDLIDFISTGYYLMKNSDTIEDKKLSELDLPNSIFIHYLSSLSWIYDILGINNDLIIEYKKLNNNIRETMAKIREYENKIEEQSQSLIFKDILDDECYKIQTVLFSCSCLSIESLINKFEFKFNCQFNTERFYIHYLLDKKDMENDNLSNAIKSIILKISKSFELSYPFGKQSSECYLLLNDYNINKLNTILNQFYFQITNIETEYKVNDLVITYFQIRSTNLKMTIDSINSYYQENNLLE